MAPEILLLRYDGRKARRMYLLGFGLALIGLVAGSLQPVTGFGLLVSVALVFGGAVVGSLAWRRMNDTRIILQIGPDGLRDLRLSPHLISWEQIIAIEVRDTGGRRPMPYLDVFLDTSAPAVKVPHLALWRLAGTRGCPISADGLDGGFHSVLLAVSRHAGEKGVRLFA